MINCVICNRTPTEEQSKYCQHCLVYIPQIEDQKYIGSDEIFCGNCNFSLGVKRIATCPNCHEKVSLDNHIKIHENNTESSTREKNRALLAKQILGDKSMHEQIIQMMGLDRMSAVEQGVALTALSLEKMNGLSTDYNFKESHTLMDMGYGLAEEVGELWAIRIAKSRLATFYLRKGNIPLANSIFYQLYLEEINKTELENLRYLNTFANLALSHRLLGNISLANEISDVVYREIEPIFLKIQEEATTYIENGPPKSELQGMSGDVVSFPRMDLIADILIVMLDEAIVHGRQNGMQISDEVLNRFLEFDNIMEILTKMSPVDDHGYFASYFREYIRFFTTLLWYGDLLIRNDDLKRHVIIERGYIMITRWLDLIPLNFFLPLRLSKTIEIFLRISTWHESIDGEQFIKLILDKTSKYNLASFLYFIAEAYANMEKYETALTYIEQMLDVKEIDDGLRELASKLKWRVQLEQNGIILGVSTLGSRIEYPVNIQLERINNSFEPETYIREMLDKTSPVLRLAFEAGGLVKENIGLFSERLFIHFKNVNETIISVGDKHYNDMKWDYGRQLAKWNIVDPNEFIIQGHRHEIIILQTQIRGEDIFLLFEGTSQEYLLDLNTITINPASLLILRGIIQHNEVELFELMEQLVTVMSGDPDAMVNTQCFVLKKKD